MTRVVRLAVVFQICWLIVPACSKASSPPAGCVQKAAWAAMVSIYCRPNTDRQQLGRWLSWFAQEKSSANGMNQIHILVSSVESAAARGPKDINYVADSILATVDWNRSTGFVEMKCRLDAGAALTDCTNLLAR